MNNDRKQAFSLIELLIVLAIIAILLVIAIPSYNSYIERTRRTDAKAALLETASLMEQHFLQNNEYTDDLTLIGADPTTEDGTYTIAVAVPSTDGTAAYEITATPVGAQADDACEAFTYDALGVKGVTGTKTVADCW